MLSVAFLFFFYITYARLYQRVKLKAQENIFVSAWKAAFWINHVCPVNAVVVDIKR